MKAGEERIADGLVEVRELPDAARAYLDPRATHVVWKALRLTSLRASATNSSWGLSAALRATSDVLLRGYEAERTCFFTRIETRHDDAGRAQLSLCLAVGVLGSPEEATIDAEHLARASLVALHRNTAPMNFEPMSPAELLDKAPRYAATIGQRRLAIAGDDGEVELVSRWDHPQPESWEQLGHLLLDHPAPLILQASFASTALTPAESAELERRACAAEEIRRKAVEARNPVVVVSAGRAVETFSDLAQSFAGLLFAGSFVVGSPEPLPQPTLRAIANDISTEFDVIHAGQAAPVVAARARLVGGYEIDHSTQEPGETIRLGLPAPALRPRGLHELFSATEASLAFRGIVGHVPTLPIEGSPGIKPPADLPDDGIRLGSDTDGRPVYLGRVAGHLWGQGATGGGKSTAAIAVAESCLDGDVSVVVLDPHGTTVRAIRAKALAMNREVGLFDTAEERALKLDLLSGLDIATATKDEIDKVVGRAVVDAASSHLPDTWTGVRWQQGARAAGWIAITAPPEHRLRYSDVGRLLLDQSFCEQILADHPRARSESALVLRKLHRESDENGVRLWLAAKFDSIASSAMARNLFAPFGEGVSVAQLLDNGIPLLADLSDGSRLESRLAGHIFLTTVLDYVFTRPVAERKPLCLIVDEASIFPSVALCRALAEGRKFGLQLFTLNQSISQLDEELVDALAANAGRIMFRLGLRDAHMLAPLMGGAVEDLTDLKNLTALVQLPGKSSFTVNFEPPALVGELPAYEPPSILEKHRPLSSRSPDAVPPFPREPVDARGELWERLMAELRSANELSDDLRAREEMLTWLDASVHALKVDGSRLLLVVDDDRTAFVVRASFLEAIQARIDDCYRQGVEVVVAAGEEVGERST